MRMVLPPIFIYANIVIVLLFLLVIRYLFSFRFLKKDYVGIIMWNYNKKSCCKINSTTGLMWLNTRDYCWLILTSN